MVSRDDKARYGFAEAFLKQNEEIRKLVNKAARKGFTLDRFEYDLRATQWYRNRTSAARNWEVLQKTQPREAKVQMGNAREAVRQMAATLGVRLSNREVNTLATRSIRQDWDASELQFRVGARWGLDDTNKDKGGAAATAHQEITEMTRQYGVNISSKTRERWARQVAQGVASPDSFRDYVVDKAKGKFSAIAGDLDRGLTTDQLFDPYRQEAAATLGLNPETVDITDPKFAKVFSYQEPGESGHRAMTLEEFSRELRTQDRYGFDDTQNAKSMATQLSAAIQSEFGVRG